MNDLQKFNFENHEVRTIVKNNEVFFVGKDIAECLGYKDTVDALKRHVSHDDKLMGCFTVSGQKRNMITINESGLYCLVLSSKLPDAKKFKRWVTSEVLPTIRKHGAYMTDETLEKAILSPDFLIKLATELKEEQEKRKLLEVENSQLTVSNQIMQPKADYFDELVDRNLLTNLRETAKELKIKQNDFINFLVEKKYLFRNQKGKLEPYASKNDGLFEIKECFNRSTDWTGIQTLVTPKGRETFRILLSE